MMTGATPAELHEILNEDTQWLAHHYKTIKSSNNNDDSETLTIDVALQNAKESEIIKKKHRYVGNVQ